MKSVFSMVGLVVVLAVVGVLVKRQMVALPQPSQHCPVQLSPPRVYLEVVRPRPQPRRAIRSTKSKSKWIN